MKLYMLHAKNKFAKLVHLVGLIINKTGNVCINVTLRLVRAIIVVVEKQ